MIHELNRRFAKHIDIAPEVFERPLITVELPPGQETRPEAVAAFALAANLLARLFRRVHLVAPNAPLGVHPWSLKCVHDLLEPLNALSEGTVQLGAPPLSDVVLGIGCPPTVAGRRSTFIGFNGWLASLDQPMDGGVCGVLGALFAACYGCAQVFLHAAELGGSRHRPMPPFSLSLLTYDSSTTNAPMPAGVDLQKVHLVGVGAVGCAAIYVLGHIADLRGRLHAIDNDVVDGDNLHRYCLMRVLDVGKAKPVIAVEALAGRGVDVVAHHISFKDFTAVHGSHIDVLLTPVDSELGRRTLAADLPRTVLNAATGGTTVTLSRHGFGDGSACLRCLYLPKAEDRSPEQQMAIDMGLGVEEVQVHLAENIPLDEELVRRVEAHRGMEWGRFQEWIGKHLQSFYAKAVCGEAVIQVASGTLVAPLSFISAIAGVLLAVELVKMRVPQLAPFGLNNYFRLDTFFPPNASFREQRRQEPSRRCICWDPDYVDRYREKYMP